MSITLYWGSGSPFAWRVQLVLEAKHLSWESKLLSFSAGDTRSAEFLALNPRGKVPVLVDDGFVVRESQAIIHYLERQYPEPALLGRAPREAASIMQSICELNAYLEQPLLTIVRAFYFGEALGRRQEIIDHAATVDAELDRVEQSLTEHSGLAGDALSAADLNLYPLLPSLARALARPEAQDFNLGLAHFRASRPRLAEWMRRIEALPGYDRTYPPHWRG